MPLGGLAPWLAMPVILWLLSGLTSAEWLGFAATLALSAAVYAVGRRPATTTA